MQQIESKQFSFNPKYFKYLRNLDSKLGLLWYFLLALFPILSALIRPFGVDIPFIDDILFHLVVMLTAMSGSYTEKFNEHLRLDLGIDKNDNKVVQTLLIVRDLFGAFILFQFFIGSLELTFIAFGNETVLGIPVQVFVALIPFGLLRVYYFWVKRTVQKTHWGFHLLAAVLAVVFSFPSILNILYSTLPTVPEFLFSLEGGWYTVIPPLVPFVIVITVCMLPLGLPLYLLLGGIGMFFFLRDGLGPASVVFEGYTVLRNSAIPAIALFTLTGFLLSESNASKRLVEVFIALFGWFPGGLVFATVLVSTVFTSFTGASGVTILALGALLFSVLRSSGHYPEKFSLGLITSSGSIGILFPPSLAMILYGSIAQINILHVFLAGIIPGLLLVLGRSVFGIAISFKSHKTSSESFEPKRALRAIKDALWELLIPVLILTLYFSGLATLLETSAFAVLYTLFVEVIVKKEISLSALKTIFQKSMRIIGGVFIILMLAKGLSSFIVDAQIPQQFASFVQEAITSKVLFLLLLNLALILTGMLMDIFSAILVVVPLILPLGAAFGIEPLHLGMIFLVNLELGYLTPPVGLNLFLSSYRFSQPLSKVYKSIVPFLILQLIIVLVITFIPELSLVFVPNN